MIAFAQIHLMPDAYALTQLSAMRSDSGLRAWIPELGEAAVRCRSRPNAEDLRPLRITAREGSNCSNFLGPRMSIQLSFRSTFLSIATVFFLSVIAVVPVDAKQTQPEDRPMDFVLVHDSNCKETCTQWISAEGAITSDTPKRFKALLKSLKNRNLPVVFQSYGGDVVAALSIGRMIRAAGLETAIGRTKLSDCPMLDPRCPQKIVKNGWSVGEVHGGGAYCFSACPLLLAGGEVRAAAETSDIGFHQVTNGRKGASYGAVGRRNLDAISTRSDPALKRMLSEYLDEMGVSRDDVFAMMGLATPEGLYRVQSAEALRSGVITKVFSDTEEPGYVIHEIDAKTSENVAE